MSKTRIQLDWAPVVRSLIHRLQQSNFAVVSVHDGEERHKYSPDAPLSTVRAQAAAAVCAVDEATLTVLDLTSVETRKLALFIVLGNSPEEIVADCSCDDRLDDVLEEHHVAWRDKPCPTITVTIK